MYYLLLFLFVISSLFILRKIIAQFKYSFDWFSATLYVMVFLITCGILYILIFLPFYLIK